MDSPRPSLSANDLEAIRSAASDAGDCDLSSLANVALWGDSSGNDKARRAANRKLARMVGGAR